MRVDIITRWGLVLSRDGMILIRLTPSCVAPVPRMDIGPGFSWYSLISGDIHSSPFNLTNSIVVVILTVVQ